VDAPRASYAVNGDTAIAYGVTGDGPVDLVYIQGFVSHVELMWECRQAAAFFDRIGRWARLITIDRRGIGMSDRFSADRLPPLEVAATDILAVMDAVGSERVAILGHHEGGQLGAMLSALHPERVRTLSLIETTTNWRVVSDEGDIWPSDEELAAEIAGFGRAFGQPSEQQKLFELTAPSHAGDGDLYRFLSKLERYAASPSSTVGFLTLLFHTDITGILDAIHVPTQVLHRVEDRLLPVRYGRQLAASIPGASFVELSGGDWWPFLGDTEPLHAALETFVLGAPVPPPSVAATRALATVLVTDIVDSTGHAARAGDDPWSDVRRRHDDIVRRHLAEEGGVEVKTMGDGFLATFEGPAAAVRCASRIAADVRELGVEIRAGLHAGEVTFEGGDIAGIAVSIASRVTAMAAPSEVLVSQTVRDLVAGSGLTFEDAGEHELKGVPDRWRLFRVTS